MPHKVQRHRDAHRSPMNGDHHRPAQLAAGTLDTQRSHRHLRIQVVEQPGQAIRNRRDPRHTPSNLHAVMRSNHHTQRMRNTQRTHQRIIQRQLLDQLPHLRQLRTLSRRNNTRNITNRCRATNLTQRRHQPGVPRIVHGDTADHGNEYTAYPIRRPPNATQCKPSATNLRIAATSRRPIETFPLRAHAAGESHRSPAPHD